MKTRYVFPAIFEENKDQSVSIYFPDFPGVITVGNSLSHGIQMAKEVLGFALHQYEKEKASIPNPNAPSEINREHPSDAILHIEVFIPSANGDPCT